jgi:hypothetical protein
MQAPLSDFLARSAAQASGCPSIQQDFLHYHKFFSDIDARPREPSGPTTQRKRGTPNFEKRRWPAKFVSQAQCNECAQQFLRRELEAVEKTGKYKFEFGVTHRRYRPDRRKIIEYWVSGFRCTDATFSNLRG